MRAVIVAGQGVQDIEFQYPFYRLQEARFDVDVAVRGKQPCTGIVGLKVQPTIDVRDLLVADYDLLIIPGGVKAMEHMRLDAELVKFVADFHAAGKVIGSICSGAQLLISAGIVRGRVISAYHAMRVDVENAGAHFFDAEAVVSEGNASIGAIVTSPHYKYLGPWMRAVLATFETETARRSVL